MCYVFQVLYVGCFHVTSSPPPLISDFSIPCLHLHQQSFLTHSPWLFPNALRVSLSPVSTWRHHYSCTAPSSVTLLPAAGGHALRTPHNLLLYHQHQQRQFHASSLWKATGKKGVTPLPGSDSVALLMRFNKMLLYCIFCFCLLQTFFSCPLKSSTKVVKCSCAFVVDGNYKNFRYR